MAWSVMLAEFQTWAVARAKLARATVRYTKQRMAYMQSHGLDWEAFLRDPLEARRQGDTFLGWQGLKSESRHALRTYEKVLNVAVRWAKDRRPDAIWPSWELTKEPRSEGRTVTDDQLTAMMAYRNKSRVREARRRAMAWLAFWTRLRRSEIARIRLRDFNAETRRLWVEYPAKGGRKRWIPLPGNAWHPNGPVQRWIAVRPQPADGSDWLWTSARGGVATPMTVDSVGNDFQKMGAELGFNVSFVRTRRAGSQFLERHHVRTRVIKATLSHSSENVTEAYLSKDNRVETVEEEFQRRKVPGFANRSRGGSGTRRLPPGDFRSS